MLKYILVFVFALFFIACGVETSSSALKSGANPDSNITDPDNNTTDPDDNTTDPGTDPGVDPDSIYDTVGAVYDANACNANFYQVASDAAYAGNGSGENGSSFFVVQSQGLEIRSEHSEAEIEKLDKTWVSIYYKSFPDPTALNKQGLTSYLMEGVFYLTYDMAWSDESIAGLDNTIYVKSMQYDKPYCYRLVLNTAIGSQIDIQKVYR